MTMKEANTRAMKRMATSDPEEFYYRTRGISEEQAQELGLDMQELQRLPHPNAPKHSPTQMI